MHLAAVLSLTPFSSYGFSSVSTFRFRLLGLFFFGTRMLAALSQLVSPRLAARFGPVKTMVFTHIPASAFLVLAALMPTASLAIALLLLRMAFASMDVPVRQAYVMSVVPVEERAAAASMTSVPRSLASAISPLIAGSLLQKSTFGWPLLIGGAIKITYDILLLVQFRHVRPVE
jgi:MFS family permease